MQVARRSIHYGQLFYTSKACDSLAALIKTRTAVPTKSCPSVAELEQERGALILAHNSRVQEVRDDIIKHYEDLKERKERYDLAMDRFHSSRRFSGDRSRSSQPYSDPGRKEWGSDQWGRKASMESAEIQDYNEALSAWRAAIQDYEYAYLDRHNELQVFDQKLTRCTVQG